MDRDRVAADFTTGGHESRHDDGDHHRLSLIDGLGERVEREFHDNSLGSRPDEDIVNREAGKNRRGGKPLQSADPVESPPHAALRFTRRCRPSPSVCRLES